MAYCVVSYHCYLPSTTQGEIAVAFHVACYNSVNKGSSLLAAWSLKEKTPAHSIMYCEPDEKESRSGSLLSYYLGGSFNRIVVVVGVVVLMHALLLMHVFRCSTGIL